MEKRCPAVQGVGLPILHPAPDHTTRDEYLQELAEGLTRIEGEARHLRATVERLRKTGGVRE